MDPLAQLKTIHLPEQVHNYPLAYGWWILLFILLTLSIWVLRKYFNYRFRCRAKKQAMKSIKETNLDTNQLLSLIKWAALQYFPRDKIASLTGDNLQNFLTSCLPVKQQEKFVSLLQPVLVKRYQLNEKHNETTELSEATMLWLKYALPPKQKTLETLSDTQNSQENSSKLEGVNT